MSSVLDADDDSDLAGDVLRRNMTRRIEGTTPDDDDNKKADDDVFVVRWAGHFETTVEPVFCLVFY